MTKKIFIYGVGLIGASIALAIRKDHTVYIRGFDADPSNAALAKKLGIIDQITTDINNELVDSDLVILATPVMRSDEIIEKFASLPWRNHTIITDVGSTKKNIMDKAFKLLADKVTFIGGHPMAGSHKSGPASAKAHLFENAFYILTPFSCAGETCKKHIETLKDYLSGTRAKFIIMSAEEHDHIAGVISHFPHLIAASLVRHVQHYAQGNEKIQRLAAGGFKDITRIASSSPTMWCDITIKNSATLLLLIDNWIEEMKGVRKLVAEKLPSKIHEYFQDAKKYRDGFPSGTSGAIGGIYDLYVDIPDQAGVISHITTILAIEKISITNIRVLEMREDILGVLRLSFSTDKDRTKAKKALEAANYSIS